VFTGATVAGNRMDSSPLVNEGRAIVRHSGPSPALLNDGEAEVRGEFEGRGERTARGNEWSDGMQD